MIAWKYFLPMYWQWETFWTVIQTKGVLNLNIYLDAVGFKLDSLEKIADTRSIDGKETVIMYAIKKAELDHQRELVDPKCNSIH